MSRFIRVQAKVLPIVLADCRAELPVLTTQEPVGDLPGEPASTQREGNTRPRQATPATPPVRKELAARCAIGIAQARVPTSTLALGDLVALIVDQNGSV
jgi:hypothetical protein